MKRTPWTLALALLLTTSSASFADRDRYSSGDRCPRPDQMDNVAGLAHDIDEIADEMHERAESNNRRPDRYVAQVLGDLHDLSNAASHFHDEVESYRSDPRHTRDDFQELVNAYASVSESLQDIESRSYIDRGMERIGEILSQLDDYYGAGDRYGSGRHGRHDRYGDHGRYGRNGGRGQRYPASFELRLDAGGLLPHGGVRIRL